MKSFIDTNVLIYWVDNSSRADVVEHLLTQQAVISVQVLNEFANVLRRKRAMSLPDVEILCATLIDTCDVVDVSVRTHQTALTLMARYNMSVYDANIVAAAVMSNCAILYTEDMQDGLNVKAPASDRANALVIRNPFI
ncbi:MAG: PIN domain-containing protein [Betaproteobacteria bacterium]|nr:PIN domain-containing protein [Betaproteobacteria bacterium]NBY70522.1 PIN domain-containing protein [Betaproteobacteria bacterium]